MKNLSILGGLFFAISLTLFIPENYEFRNEVRPITWEMKSVAFLLTLMAAWWITEAIPVFATAMLPIILLPFLGVATTKEALVRYADPIIYLFLGGFILGIGLQTSGLHRRIALNTLRFFRGQPSKVIAGFMFVTAGLSM